MPITTNQVIKIRKMYLYNQRLLFHHLFEEDVSVYIGMIYGN